MASRARASEGVHRTAPSPPGRGSSSPWPSEGQYVHAANSSPESAALSACTSEGLHTRTAPYTLA
eukprot:6484266-Alexandrium_andersonii.AAC.1